MSAFGTAARFAAKSRSIGGSAARGFLTSSRNSPVIHSLSIGFSKNERRQMSNGALTKLAEAFKNEIASDKESKPDEAFVKMVAKISKTFKISDDAGKGTVVLSRQYKNESIEIVFDCQDEAEADLPEEDEEEEEEEKEEEDEEEEEEEPERGINFKVIITKPTGEKMILQCAAFDTIDISGVRYVSSENDIKDTTLYSGPVFEHLDDELRNAFFSYLEDRGINDEVSVFINYYSAEKEQNEYAYWLHQLSKFTNE